MNCYRCGVPFCGQMFGECCSFDCMTAVEATLPLRGIREVARAGEPVALRETRTQYGTEYVAVAGSAAERARQMAELDIVFLDRADGEHWARQNGVTLAEE